MILSAQAIRKANIVSPFHERTNFNGVSFGLSSCGYDIRTAQTLYFNGKNAFLLASSIEHFNMPKNIMGRVHDKSTWARQGLSVQNTVIEPGWRGYLTIEIALHLDDILIVSEGTAIAQIIFEFLNEETDQPYEGKYQNQPAIPVKGILANG